MASKLTREELLNIIETDHVQCGEAAYLARIALAAIDSEPVELPLDYLQGHKDGLEWAAQLAKANHPETGDWLYDDPIELAKAISKGPDMPPSQPALDTEPVAYTDERNLGYIDRGRETAYLWGKQNSEAGDVLLYRHAQQPVVPDDVLDALQKVARIRLELNDFDGDRRGIAFCLSEAEEALIEVVNRRAAMLQAGDTVRDLSTPVDPQVAEYEQNVMQAGNSPVIPDGSASMLRRWLAFGRGMQNAGCQLPRNLIAETEEMLAAAPQEPKP
ncbi:hypothetical protein [Klebsiella michiganensis]|uniref:hypothetical protein n=1 Tax=Klebsiella michiganensis TaxID=1134687 RepID=UPI002175054A|nr:hypothetical protein [Klebsiella michiganensis]